MKDTHVQIKRLGSDTYDIWWGVGWDNWSRVKIVVANGRPLFTHMKGYKLPFPIQAATTRYLKLI